MTSSPAPGGRRLQIAAGVLLAVVAVVAVLVAVTAGPGTSAKPVHHGSATIPAATIPPATNANLRSAAAAAGCVLLHPASEGRLHVLGHVNYRSNPPSSGPHFPVPAHDGIYDPGNTPPAEQLVHSLEHGRIEIQYRAGVGADTVGALQALVEEFSARDSDPRVLLFQNATQMPYAVAAVAWTRILGCNSYTPAALDAIRDFRTAYDLKAPEQLFVGAE